MALKNEIHNEKPNKTINNDNLLENNELFDISHMEIVSAQNICENFNSITSVSGVNNTSATNNTLVNVDPNDNTLNYEVTSANYEEYCNQITTTDQNLPELPHNIPAPIVGGETSNLDINETDDAKKYWNGTPPTEIIRNEDYSNTSYSSDSEYIIQELSNNPSASQSNLNKENVENTSACESQPNEDNDVYYGNMQEGRKRNCVANANSWKRNHNKKLRMEGSAYLGYTRKDGKAKKE